MTRHWLMDEWRDTFVIELRLRGVPGRQIGEALAEVDAHCADSGESPGQAFGEPAGYAAARAQAGKRTRPLTAAVAVGSGVAGIAGLLSGTSAVAEHAPAAVTAGELIPVAVAPILAAAIVTALQRPGQRPRRALFTAALPVCVTAAAAPQFLWQQPVFQVPGPALLAAGMLLFGIPAAWLARAGRGRADRVIDPRTGSEPFLAPAWVPPLIRFALPAVLLAAVLLVLLVRVRNSA